MILWLKRIAVLLNGFLLFAFLFRINTALAVFGGALNMGWIVGDKLPLRLRLFFHPAILVFNTACLTYGVIKDGSAWLAISLAGSALMGWNAGLFMQNNPEASWIQQYRYCGNLGLAVLSGLAAGFSALALQGHFSLAFPLTFLLMLANGFLWLKLLSGSLKKEPRHPDPFNTAERTINPKKPGNLKHQ